MHQVDLDDVEAYLMAQARHGNRKMFMGWLRKRFAELRAREDAMNAGTKCG